MNQSHDLLPLLSLIPCPAFAVRDGIVLCCNPLAEGSVPQPGESILPLLLTGQEEFTQASSDVLYISMRYGDRPCWATVTTMDGWQLFQVSQESLPSELKGMSLVCTDLRLPISNLSMIVNRIAEECSEDHANQLHQSVAQTLRILNNVANANRFSDDRSQLLEDRNICAVTEEILSECQELLAQSGTTLRYTLPQNTVITQLDTDAYRQAIYSLLDNAVLAAPGSPITVSLSLKGNRVLLTVTDQGPGIAEEEKPLLFQSYRRQPSLSASSCKSGLGLALVRCAATIHSGSVLVSSPKGGPTKVCLALPVQKSKNIVMRNRSNIMVPSLDNARIMLSNVLSPKLYKKD